VIRHSIVEIKSSYVLLALSPCVLIQKYLHLASALKTASASASRFCLGVRTTDHEPILASSSASLPHLTSLIRTNVAVDIVDLRAQADASMPASNNNVNYTIYSNF